MEKPRNESITVEFKSDRRPLPMDELYKEVVSLANTDGGIICLGIEDNGLVSGVDKQHTDLIEMAAKIQAHTVPAVFARLWIENWDGKDVLIAEVPQSRQLVMTSDGRYLRRQLLAGKSTPGYP